MASAMSGLRANFSRMKLLAGLDRSPVHPRQKAQREHVFGALAVFLRRTDRLDGAERQRGHRDGMHDVVGQLVGLQRVCYVTHLRQVALGEFVGVRDHHSAARQVADVGLQRRRVHRDEHVRPVAGGQDVVVGDLNLEGRDPGQCACGGPDLGGIVRLSRQVVAEKRCLRREPVAGELHAVAGVPGESDDDLFQALTVGAARKGPRAVMRI